MDKNWFEIVATCAMGAIVLLILTLITCTIKFVFFGG
jgi:hypothetical protein